jgi:cytoskeleton protein RodZ
LNNPAERVSSAEVGVGAELAAARQERGIGLPEVAQQLKFGLRQLEALEADRFAELPGGTFARGMVRSYARLLKVDPEPLLARIAGRFDAPDSNNLAARFSQPVPFSNPGRRSTLVYFGLSLGILVVVGGIAYQWQQERNAPGRMAFVKPKAENPARKPVLPAQTASVAAAPVAEAPAMEERKPPVAAKKPAVEEKKAVEQKKAEQKIAEQKTAEAKKPEEKKAAERKPAPIVQATAAAAAPPSGVHRIVMRVETDEAWLEVTDAAGRQLVSSLNRAGSERVVQGRGPFTFVIGNASHVRVVHNDREVDLKPHTRVEVARFTLP